MSHPSANGLGPTLIDHVTPEMSVYTDEIFGPVLSVLRVDTCDKTLELINTNPYGNGTVDLHQRLRGRAALPERGRGRHGRHQRAQYWLDPSHGGINLGFPQNK